MLSSIPMRAFIQAILAGVAAGAFLPTLLTIGIAVTLLPDVLHGTTQVRSILYLVALPVLVTVPLVLLGSVLIGLPATLLLKRRGQESAAAYMLVGAIGGTAILLLALLLMRASEGGWLCLLGAFSGAVTGGTWWRAARKSKSTEPPNPVIRNVSLSDGNHLSDTHG
jgi:hypothetical protein